MALDILFAISEHWGMTDAVSPATINRKLQDMGLSRSYASQLANGVRTPSLELAGRIEREAGIPMSHWVAGGHGEAASA